MIASSRVPPPLVLSVIWFKLRLLKLFAYEKKHEKEEVIDIPDAVIKTLPPNQRKDYRNISLVICAASSEKAVTDIRSVKRGGI